MASISSSVTSGISGGALDVNTIVTQLMEVERLPLVALNNTVTKNQTQISELGIISSQMAALQNAAKKLNSSDTSALLATSASSANPSVFTATTASSTSAVAGSYSVVVSQLAQSQQLASNGLASDTAAIGDGTATTINFTFGTISGGSVSNGIYSGASFTAGEAGTKSIVIDSNNNTLQGIRDAINGAQLGVTATIINDGSGNPFRLVLSSNETGVNSSLKISTDGANAELDSLLAYDPAGTQNLTQTVAAQNAEFTLNGIAISKNSNTVTDAVAGVTMELKSTSASAVTLTVGRDTAGINSAVTEFANAYNTLWNTLKTSATYASGSVLAGNPILSSLQNQMRAIGDATVGTGDISRLFQIGVSFEKNGSMSVDETKLNSMLNSNFNGVSNLFSSENGISAQMSAWVTNQGGLAGSIAQITSSLRANITRLNSQVDAFNHRMDMLQVQYTTTFSSLNAMLQNMQATSNYLAQQLGNKDS